MSKPHFKVGLCLQRLVLVMLCYGVVLKIIPIIITNAKWLVIDISIIGFIKDSVNASNVQFCKNKKLAL